MTTLTTSSALRIIIRCSWFIIRRFASAVNAIVHRFPWAAILFSAVITFVLSLVQVYHARAERDLASRQSYHLQMQLDSVTACLNAAHHQQKQ